MGKSKVIKGGKIATKVASKPETSKPVVKAEKPPVKAVVVSSKKDRKSAPKVEESSTADEEVLDLEEEDMEEEDDIDMEDMSSDMEEEEDSEEASTSEEERVKKSNKKSDKKVEETKTKKTDKKEEDSDENKNEESMEENSDEEEDEESMEGEQQSAEEQESVEEGSNDERSDEDSKDSEDGDEIETWEEFGQQYLDRRITKVLTKEFGYGKPTLVQAKCIPLALEGRDILCKAKTGSGKTLAYLIPVVNALLQADSFTGSSAGGTATATTKSTNLGGSCKAVVLVPSKELCVQVHQVLEKLLSLSFDFISSGYVLPGQTYMKPELPTILVCSPTSLAQLLKVRGTKLDHLKMLAVDEADLMLTYGYEESMKNLKDFLPNRYQAILCSATLTEDVQQLKGLILHKPAILKLADEEIDSHSNSELRQFYLAINKLDKYMVLYAFIKLKIVSGKILIFVKDIESAYGLKLFYEKFGIVSSVLNSELSFESRQNVIQSFNQNLCNIVIATDEGFEMDQGGNTMLKLAEGKKKSDDEEKDSDEEEESDEEDSDGFLDEKFGSDSEEKVEKKKRPSTINMKLDAPEIGAKPVYSEEIKNLKAQNARKQKQMEKRLAAEKARKAKEEVDSDDEMDSDEEGASQKDSSDGENMDDEEMSDEEEEDNEELEDEELNGADDDVEGSDEASDDDSSAKKKIDSKKDSKKDIKKPSKKDDDFGEEFSDMEDENDGDDDIPEMDDDENDEEEEDSEDSEGLSKVDKKASIETAGKQFSVTRGLDFKDVGTVINADMPKTVRAYIHRVGRTARGGQDGTALSLVDKNDMPQLELMHSIMENSHRIFGNKKSLGVQELPFSMASIERLRYRVTDISNSVTKKAVQVLRLRELQQEAVNSARLQAHFEDNPHDLRALQKSQRELKQKKHVQQHLRYLPEYLVPDEQMQQADSSDKAANPVRKAVLDAAKAEGVANGSSTGMANMGSHKNRIKRSMYNDAMSMAMNSSASAGSGKIPTRKGGKKRITEEQMEAIARRQAKNDADGLADADRLAPLSGRKIWKMNRGKALKKRDRSAFGMAGRKMGNASRKRAKIFRI